MLKEIGDLYALLFGWPALARMHKGLLYMSSRALGLCNYSNASISGERWLVRHRLAGAMQAVVFDIGANNGEWLADVLRVNRSAQIHAFEPQQVLAERIVASHRDVKVINAAVGAEAGFLELFDYADHPGSQHASLVQGVIDAVHGGTARSTRVRVVTLDDYCAEHHVARIDLLKIDVEGFELQVLRGARRMLEEGRIDAIQFEVTLIRTSSGESSSTTSSGCSARVTRCIGCCPMVWRRSLARTTGLTSSSSTRTFLP